MQDIPLPKQEECLSTKTGIYPVQYTVIHYHKGSTRKIVVWIPGGVRFKWLLKSHCSWLGYWPHSYEVIVFTNNRN